MRSLRKKSIPIYLGPQKDQVLEVLSKKEGISKDGVIRKSLENFLKKIPVEEDPGTGLIRLGNSGKRNLCDHHDKYLVRYARQKKRG